MTTSLPRPTPTFTGDIQRLITDSTPARVPCETAPAGAPNVLLVLLDDVGFGSFSTFGGPIPAPGLETGAERGRRYNQVHTTALCSPSRAALLTGRNHHAVHMGGITEIANSFPGYD
ncbi:MAG: sulfatase-like hydrolase/transferase, partial [Actinomycetales bacterium]